MRRIAFGSLSPFTDISIVNASPLSIILRLRHYCRGFVAIMLPLFITTSLFSLCRHALPPITFINTPYDRRATAGRLELRWLPPPDVIVVATLATASRSLIATLASAAHWAFVCPPRHAFWASSFCSRRLRCHHAFPSCHWHLLLDLRHAA